MRYKLTTQDMKTRPGKYNEVTWVVGEWVTADGDTACGLCSAAYIHWYTDPLLAIMLNPAHADIENPRLWECETGGQEVLDYGLKGGSRSLRLLREIPVPIITTRQRVHFAILCVRAICKDRVWNELADLFLNGCVISREQALSVFDHLRCVDHPSAAWVAAVAICKSSNPGCSHTVALSAAQAVCDSIAEYAEKDLLLDLEALAREAVSSGDKKQ